MDLELKKELITLASQDFFETHFNYGNDNEITKQNYQTGLDLLIESYHTACGFTERIVNGEIVDTTLLNKTLQELLFSFRFTRQFKTDLTNTDLIDPCKLSLEVNAVDRSILGNKYMGQYALSHDLNDYEIGRWYLYGLN